MSGSMVILTDAHGWILDADGDREFAVPDRVETGGRADAGDETDTDVEPEKPEGETATDG